MNPTKVVIRISDYDICKEDVELHAKKGNETGQSLIGRIHPNGVYEITKVVLAGPKAKRGPASFSTDPEVVKEALQEEMSHDGQLRYLGDMHSHPWPSPPRPSFIDIGALIESRKTRPWFVIAIHSLSQTKFFGLNDDQSDVVEIPHQVVPDGFDDTDLLSRIAELTDHSLLAKKNVAVVGCGSLGSAVITGLAGTGFRKIILADMDELEAVNLVRHVGGIYDIGTAKAEIMKDYLEAHSPLAHVQAVQEDLIKNRELLRAIIEWADVVIASSGNPELNYHINSTCIEMKKPAVYGGIYARAESAYALATKADGTNACFDCIFELTSATIDEGAIRRKYGLEDGELHKAQGMFSDISIPAHMMVKMALWLLTGEDRGFNLVRYFNYLTVKRQKVERRPLCPTCDYDNWLAERVSKPERMEVMQEGVAP